MEQKKGKYWKLSQKAAEQHTNLDVVYAFVTLKSMDDVRLLKAAYQYSTFDRLMAACCCCCFSQRARLISKGKFQGRWLNVKTAILPDNIIWQNMGVGKINMWFRQTLQLVIGLVILVGAMALTLYLNAY